MSKSKTTIVNQWGSNSIPFSEYSKAETEHFVSGLINFIAECKSVTGFDIFSTYGTLLGAVREGDVISQDFDFDLCLVIKNVDKKEELVEKFAEAIRKVKNIDSVVEVIVSSATQYAVSLAFDGLKFTVDFFLGWFDKGVFHQAFSIDERFGILESDVYPLTRIKFSNTEILAPRNYEIFLRAIYGDSWNIRDDGFSYMSYFSKLGGLPPPENTVFGRVNFNKDYWDTYYEKNNNVAAPSQFAIFAESWFENKINILEVGAGSGRDSIYFLARGHQVTVTDYSSSALGLISSQAPDGADVELQNLDYADTLKMDDFSKKNAGGFDVFYSRFLFHAVSEVGELNLINLARNSLRKDGLLMAEFRVYGDGRFDKHKPWDELELTSDHYRRPLVTKDFIDRLSCRGFDVIYKAEGRGFAYHKSEDPLVARIVAKKMDG